MNPPEAWWLWLWVVAGVVALVWLVDRWYRSAVARLGFTSPTRVPEREMQSWRKTTMDATVLARAGKAADGYERLLAGRSRALELRDEGALWGEELVRLYQEVLNWYSTRHLADEAQSQGDG